MTNGIESRVVYIYGLWDSRDSRLRYIGKTINPKARLRRHCLDYDKGKITHCSTWVKGLLNDGLEPMMEILEECTEETWREAERDWIAKARGFGLDLVNMVDGGMGGAVRGRKLSKEHIEKMVKARVYKPSPLKGRPLSPERKAQLLAARQGVKPRLGMKNSPEQNAKIGAANAIALKGRKLDEAHLIELRKNGLKRWETEGASDKQREAMEKNGRNDKGQFLSKREEEKE